MNLLVVEDEVRVADFIQRGLRAEGWTVSVAPDGETALALMAGGDFDVVVLDLMLPGKSGQQICRQLRRQGDHTPVLMLSALDDVDDRVAGLRLGADDYLTKNISLDHLMARVAALFRRVDALEAAPAQEETLERGDLTLDTARLMARWKGEPVPLTVTEFWVVHSLAEHPGHVRNRDQLMAAASTVLDDSSVTSQIKRVRAKFTALDPNFAEIETVYGMGYRWVGSAQG